MLSRFRCGRLAYPIGKRAPQMVLKRDVPALGAVRIQREQLDQVLHKIMDTIGTNVRLREDIVGIWCREEPRCSSNTV